MRKHLLQRSSIDGLLHDVRYAARVLLNSRGFTVVASLRSRSLGATTTIFSVAKQLYERLPCLQAANLRLSPGRVAEIARCRPAFLPGLRTAPRAQ
jgi:hypothetical protein